MSQMDRKPEIPVSEETQAVEQVIDMTAFRTEIDALIAERKKQYSDMIEIIDM